MFVIIELIRELILGGLLEDRGRVFYESSIIVLGAI
jgi:hypothetical protein